MRRPYARTHERVKSRALTEAASLLNRFTPKIHRSRPAERNATAMPTANNHGRQTTRLMPWLFWLTVAWGASIFWLAPHPPMVDMPQHAGQVALWRDLLLGRTPFAEQFQINLLTPYMLAYGLSLPLSFILPVAVALKTLLSVAYVGFVVACIALRRRFEADPRLDWFFLVAFFGVAYRWGLLTFLVAAPVCLSFVLLAESHARRPSGATGTRLGLMGLLLLASHGLAFLLGLVLGATLLLAATWKRKRVALFDWLPYAVLLAAFAGYFLLSRALEATLPMPGGGDFEGAWGWHRLTTVPTFAIGGLEDRRLLAVVAVMALAPFLIGLRPRSPANPSVLIFGVVIAVLALAPAFAAKTGLIYERFALYLLPAYAWMFARRPSSNVAGTKRLLATLTMAVVVGACWSALAVRSVQAISFREETATIDAALRSLEPGQRALGLSFDPGSRASRGWLTYLHYPVWYQAEGGGFVDFNFAWFPPQVVRFRPGRQPVVTRELEGRPEQFDWSRHRGDLYRYFIVRHTRALPASLFSNADCDVKIIRSLPDWTIFERTACKVTATPPSTEAAPR